MNIIYTTAPEATGTLADLETAIMDADLDALKEIVKTQVAIYPKVITQVARIPLVGGRERTLKQLIRSKNEDMVETAWIVAESAMSDIANSAKAFTDESTYKQDLAKEIASNVILRNMVG